MNLVRKNKLMMQQKPESLSFIVKVVLICYFCSYMFDGSIRYILSLVGLTSFLYLRDLVPFIILAIVFNNWLSDRHGQWWPAMPTAFLFILVFHFLVGVLQQQPITQLLFGFKLYVPLLLGISLAYLVRLEHLDYGKTFLILWILLCTGIIINYFTQFPWEGESFVSVFGETKSSKLWYSQGERRLAGFARSSISAASSILILTIFIVPKIKKNITLVAFWMTSLMVIKITTTKGALLSMCMLAITYLIIRDNKQNMGILFLYVFVSAFSLFIPFILIAGNLNYFQLPNNIQLSFHSLLERITWAWPSAIEAMFSNGNLVFGAGPGAVGVSQRYFGDWWNYTPGDNFFVYWVVTFGLVGIVYICAIWFKSIIPKSNELVYLRIYYAGMIAILTNGLTTNIVEQPILSCMLGYFITCLAVPKVNVISMFNAKNKQ